ncbi:MAG: dephospho-CoA kinase [Spirochaetes bacterium]|nr:dephospho-CoA kinase [Spirochaetota bacterium]
MVVGITGGYCCGKSAARALFEQEGYIGIDVDRIGHEVLQEKKDEVVEVFGEGVLSGGRIERRTLGRIVFADAQKRRRLEEILHPPMIERVRRALDGCRNAVIDAALLIEMDLSSFCDFVIGILVDDEVAILRGMERDGLSRDETLRRILSQIPLKEKLFCVDKVIENNATVREFRRRVRETISVLAKKE